MGPGGTRERDRDMGHGTWDQGPGMSNLEGDVNFLVRGNQASGGVDSMAEIQVFPGGSLSQC